MVPAKHINNNIKLIKIGSITKAIINDRINNVIISRYKAMIKL